MINKTLLTIAVPTYNRKKELEELLKCIYSTKALDVEILVSDNASTDKTEIVCRKYLQRYTNFTYFKQEKNQGYDLNVIKCIELCKTEYLWFLSDDDIVDCQLIKEVLVYLEQNNVSGILINSTVIDYVTNKTIIENLNNCDENYTIIINNKSLEQYGKWSTLISSIVIKKSLIQINSLNKYIGSCFVQLGVFWRSLIGEQILILGKKKIIKRDGKEAEFNISSSKIWLNNWINTIWSLRDLYDEKSCIIAAGKMYDERIWSTSSFFTHFLVAIKNGDMSKEDLKELLYKVKLSNTQKNMSIFIILLPKSFLLGLYSFVRGVYKIVNRMR